MSKPLDAIAGLFKAAAMHSVKDHAQSMGAALAFYTIFSIAPLLVIVIAIAGSISGEEAARGEIYSQLQGMLGSHGAAAVQGLLESVGRRSDSAPAAALGAVVLFVGATSVFAELQDALDRIWRAPQRARRAGLWSLVRARLLSFGMVLGHHLPAHRLAGLQRGDAGAEPVVGPGVDQLDHLQRLDGAFAERCGC